MDIDMDTGNHKTRLGRESVSRQYFFCLGLVTSDLETRSR